MGDELRRAGQPDLFTGEKRHHERAPVQRRGDRLRKTRRREECGDDAGRVVVGAGVDAVRVGTERSRSPVAEVIVVRAEHHDLVREVSAPGKDAGDVRGVEVGRLQVHAARHARARDHLRARGEVAVDGGLEGGEVDAGRGQPSARDGELHLEDRDSRSALRAVVAQRGKAILPVVLRGTGDEDHRRRPALARLQDLVTHPRPSAGALAVEGRGLVLLLGLVAEEEDDLAAEIEPVELAIANRRRLHAVPAKDELSGERARARKGKRCPLVGGHAFEVVGGRPGNPGLDAERLAIAAAKGRLEAEGAEARLDEIRGTCEARGSQTPSLHCVRGQDGNVAPELRGGAPRSGRRSAACGHSACGQDGQSRRQHFHQGHQSGPPHRALRA